jgi:hypothetical protein
MAMVECGKLMVPGKHSFNENHSKISQTEGRSTFITKIKWNYE